VCRSSTLSHTHWENRQLVDDESEHVGHHNLRDRYGEPQPVDQSIQPGMRVRQQVQHLP
jgi:hypothetical protein